MSSSPEHKAKASTQSVLRMALAVKTLSRRIPSARPIVARQAWGKRHGDICIFLTVQSPAGKTSYHLRTITVAGLTFPVGATVRSSTLTRAETSHAGTVASQFIDALAQSEEVSSSRVRCKPASDFASGAGLNAKSQHLGHVARDVFRESYSKCKSTMCWNGQAQIDGPAMFLSLCREMQR